MGNRNGSIHQRKDDKNRLVSPNRLPDLNSNHGLSALDDKVKIFSEKDGECEQKFIGEKDFKLYNPPDYQNHEDSDKMRNTKEISQHQNSFKSTVAELNKITSSCPDVIQVFSDLYDPPDYQNYEDLDKMRNTKEISQQQNSLKSTGTKVNQISCADEATMLMSKLQSDMHLYNETLGDLYAFIKQEKTVEEHQSVMYVLISGGFLNKFDNYLQFYGINSFTALQNQANITGTCISTVWPVVKKFLTITWFVCDKDVNFCQYVLESRTFMFLVSDLRNISALNYEGMDMLLFTVKAMLGILHNICRHVINSKWSFRNKGLVDILRTFLPSQIAMIRLKTLVVLSYILSEAENEIINSEDDNFIFIFEVLLDAIKSGDHRSKKFGMSVLEILKGINNLAINEENKIRIVRNGALPLYETLLFEDGFPEEKKVIITTLWSLAFHHYNKRRMREMPGMMGKLYELRQCGEEEICHAARGTFWELDNMSKNDISNDSKLFLSSAERDANRPHIMISYQWDSQPIMIKVKDRLKHAGYKVWMDVEHMTGSTLDAMALAVEKAAVILICMSQKYKESLNCRMEAEYVIRLRKDFVPLRLQQDYCPDGWLGIMAGTRLYFDMYTEEIVENQLPKLVKELSDRGRIRLSADEPDMVVTRRLTSREAVPLSRLSMPSDDEISPESDMPGLSVERNWGTQNIQEWLTSVGIADIYDSIGEMDGSLLLEMQRIQKTAPEFFYTMLRDDFKLSIVNIMKFSKALRSLR